jgi:hypothetical protein
MTCTAFIGAYGYGNLGDELCLIEAMQRFPDGPAYALAPDAEWTMRCVPGIVGCFRKGAEMLALAPRRIVFGGGLVGRSRTFRNWLPWIAQAMAQGAEVHFNNLGVERLSKDLTWLDDAARAVFAGAASFTVRDPTSFEMVAEAAIGRMPGVTHYPEADIEPETDLAERLLPPGVAGGRKLLGVSIINNPEMRACLTADADRVRAALAEFRDHAVVPVVSTRHIDSGDENDATGMAEFAAEFLADHPIVARELLDAAFWRAELTPRRLKGIIARCDTLLTHRKHNSIHAIGAGVRVVGINPMVNDSLRRTFVALANRMPPGSRYVGLEGAG